MSDADRLPIASVAALPISGSSHVISNVDIPGNDQVPNPYPTTTNSVPTGRRTSQDTVAALKLESDVPSASGRTLTMVLVSNKDKETKDKETEETYAVVPIPETYEVS